MRYLSPAKLNLFLHLTGRRDDGYHNLETLFQLLDFYDELTFSDYASNGPITLELAQGCPALDVDDTDNLIYRAAQALAEATGCQRGARISLTKQIPMGGGLGGGSSNAATTLIALNALWQTGLSRAELCELGLALGADVPVFVQQRTALASGLGEQLTPVALQPCYYLLVIPPCHVSTQQLFAHPELQRNTPTLNMQEKSPDYWQTSDWFTSSHNDFEPIARQLFKPVDQCFRVLEDFCEPRLTGTGACLFARFSDKNTALQSEQRLAHDPTALPADTRWSLHQGISHSPEPEF